MKRRLSHGTYLDYRNKLKVFVAWAEAQHQGLEYVGRSAVADFLEDLVSERRGHKGNALAANTRASYVRVIKSFLNWCWRDTVTYGEYMSRDTIATIPLPKIPLTITTTFSDEQVSELYRAASSTRDKEMKARNMAILYILFNCGLRASEVCHLKIGDIDLDPQSPGLKVFGKGSKERFVNMGELTRRKVESYLTTYRSDAEAAAHAFLALSGSRYRKHGPLTVSGLEQLFKKLVKAADITNFRATPHDARHYYATSWIRRGGDVFVLSKTLGHAGSLHNPALFSLNADPLELARSASGIVAVKDL